MDQAPASKPMGIPLNATNKTKTLRTITYENCKKKLEWEQDVIANNQTSMSFVVAFPLDRYEWSTNTIAQVVVHSK
jgi:hypothetical protein